MNSSWIRVQSGFRAGAAALLVMSSGVAEPALAVEPAATVAPTQPASPPLAREISEATLVSREGRSYRLRVSAPTAPAPAGGYPVLYVLDGDGWVGTAVEVARLREYEKLPPMIVVGVGYPSGSFFDGARRTYDFTPSGVTDPRFEGAETGGADQFLAFLNGPVKAWVGARYHVDASRQGLFGHSMGGLFVTHVLFTSPRSFSAYLAASPSLWFGDKAVLTEEAAFLANPARSGVRVQVTVGEFESPRRSEPLMADYRRYYADHPEARGGRSPDELVRDLFAPSPKPADMIGDAHALADRLAAAGVRTTFAQFPGEEHMSAAVSALNRGVPFMLRP